MNKIYHIKMYSFTITRLDRKKQLMRTAIKISFVDRREQDRMLVVRTIVPGLPGIVIACNFFNSFP